MQHSSLQESSRDALQETSGPVVDLRIYKKNSTPQLLAQQRSGGGGTKSFAALAVISVAVFFVASLAITMQSMSIGTRWGASPVEVARLGVAYENEAGAAGELSPTDDDTDVEETGWSEANAPNGNIRGSLEDASEATDGDEGSAEEDTEDEEPEGETLDTVDEQDGLPLVDQWPEPIWAPIDNETLPEIMSMVKGMNRQGPPRCDRTTVRKQIRMAVLGSGFGASIYNMAGYSIYAHLTGRSFVFVSRRNRPFDPTRPDVKINQPNVVAELYEREFAYPRLTTVCTDWTSACSEKGDRDCTGPALSSEKERVVYRRYMEFQVLRYFPRLMRLRMELIRFFMRMKPSLRQEVDRRLAEFVPMQLFDEKSEGGNRDNGIVIGIHLRRGDKYKESIPTPAIQYAKAALKFCKDSGRKVRKVIIATDDGEAAFKAVSEWKKLVGAPDSFQPSEGFAVRAAGAAPSGRPDQLVSLDEETLKMAREGLVDLLVDQKLLVLADVFIGTQSSNFGLLVCYMRGGRDCLNAESYDEVDVAEPFKWSHAQDKPY